MDKSKSSDQYRFNGTLGMWMDTIVVNHVFNA